MSIDRAQEKLDQYRIHEMPSRPARTQANEVVRMPCGKNCFSAPVRRFAPDSTHGHILMTRLRRRLYGRMLTYQSQDCD
jgi:hypothetical protein